MGNLFTRKRVITEELENLTNQMKAYKEDIEKTYESKRMLLWYLTLLNFFLSTLIVGCVWLHFHDQLVKVGLSVGGFISGFILLILSRKIVNAYYEWILNRKQKHHDELLEKKKNILETVKETETFKKAKEILEKYDDAIVEKPVQILSQPNSPSVEIKKPGQMSHTTPLGPGPGMRIRPPIERTPPGSDRTSLGGPPMSSGRMAMPISVQMNPRGPPIRPVRPFHQEPHSAIYKMVDYFFSDGPSNRLALICTNCHGHNGMALPQEYEYLAYVCFICKHFNPAKKMRPPPELHSTSELTNEQVFHNDAPEEKEEEIENTDPNCPKESKNDTGTEDEFDVVNDHQLTESEESTEQ